MPNTHDHDDYVEIELKTGTSKLHAALEGLAPRKQKQVVRAVEVSIKEAIDQTLDWANGHFEEHDHELSAAASGVLIAMTKADDEPPVIGRVLGAFLIIGLTPDVTGALKARRAAQGAKAAAALADHLARVQKTFGGKGEKSRPRKAAGKSRAAARAQRPRGRTAKS